ncbi:leucine--tRNA ligase [Candidatus Wolfebacteria bacterium]|nr:leucine--tRNA ligase [Candidatus Wolfebacteria bacterium]
MEGYNHKDIEQKWQKAWDDAKLFAVDTKKAKNKEYLLVEFPYPSGDLHIGHWFAFAVPDIYARYLRMKGKSVLFPIGFDAFGLPAENAAIKHGLDPKEWTFKNIERMREQFKLMGNSFDWDKEVVTADPEYYKWTQWIFTKLFEEGLAYKKEATVNWDPVDKTVLANEQVQSDGTAERSGAVVEQKLMNQWFFKITKYADRLIDDLDDLDWPDEIKDAQKNWIGRSNGAEIPFTLSHGDKNWFTHVFTTRADTLMGVTFITIAPERAKDLINDGWKLGDDVATYAATAMGKNAREREVNKEKTGIKTPLVAIHPITKKELPVYVADYVLGNYGTGVVMGVPAHDERDHAFAVAYDLEIISVIDTKKEEEVPYSGEGALMNSGDFNNETTHNARESIAKAAGGEMKTTYRLRDWSIGRQRYWGCPIPIVYDPEGKAHKVPEKHLPWILPTDVDFTPTGESPLARSKELKERTEKIFGEGWTPEVETLDTFMDSSWYFYRYIDPKNKKAFADAKLLKKWMPVNKYSGGSEHTTLHVLYSRFINKALFDMKVVPHEEPFTIRTNRGLILGPDGNKMSKREGNVINPDDLVEKYGADTVKCYLAFIGPYNEPGFYPWNPDSITGIRRFLDRIYTLSKKIGNMEDDEVTLQLHKTIEKVSRDLPESKFHTSLAALMSLLNILEKKDIISKDVYETILLLLAPFAPHITQELWEKIGNTGFIHTEAWPDFDTKVLEAATIMLAVQINGKSRGTIEVSQDITEQEALDIIKENERISAHIGENKIKKVIFVPGRIINILTT